MGIPRYRSKGSFDTSKVGTIIGRGTSYKSFCPNISYYEPGSAIYYPASHKYGEETYCWDEIHKGPPYREGGPLFLVRKRVEHQDIDPAQYCTRAYRYTGAFTLDIDENELDSTFNGYAPTAGSFGAEAWNKFRPVKPYSDAGQWLAELRDMPKNPMGPLHFAKGALKRMVKNFCDLGSQYLNYEFGWKPFITDLIKMYELTKKLENRISWVRKNNNKWIRRKGTLRDQTTTTVTEVTSKVHPKLHSAYWASTSWTCKRTLVETDKIWFEAVCKFYIPDLAGPWNMNTRGTPDEAKSVWDSRLVRKMYGFELTPSLAWELIPFSWLEDWFINFGDVFSNISNQVYDNLVVKYAYVMRHRRKVLEYLEYPPMRITSPVCIGSSFGPYKLVSPFKLSATITVECKEREHASQLGFGGGGILEEGLTPRQERILSALGMPRLR